MPDNDSGVANTSELGIDPEELWQTADKLRGSIDAAEYKHVVLGLIFLKYISDAFEARRSKAISLLMSSAISTTPLRSWFFRFLARSKFLRISFHSLSSGDAMLAKDDDCLGMEFF